MGIACRVNSNGSEHMVLIASPVSSKVHSILRSNQAMRELRELSRAASAISEAFKVMAEATCTPASYNALRGSPELVVAHQLAAVEIMEPYLTLSCSDEASEWKAARDGSDSAGNTS
jgi:hypothetical protein